MEKHSREAVAVEAAETGAEYAFEHFRTDFDIEQKGDKTDLVTEIDRETQRRVISTIRERFPDDAVVGEEEDERKTVPESGYAWVIDPIDGTQNFTRGTNAWVTSVAIVEDMEPLAAVNVAPATGDTYVTTGGEIERNGRPITVNDEPDIEAFIVASTLRFGPEDRPAVETLAGEIFGRFGELRRIGTTQLTLSRVADGSIDAVVGLDEHPNAWDTVAGVHHVRQAGGVVTDIHGNEWLPGRPGLVASNGRAHEEVLETAQAAFEAIH
ncbi:inositol monophosphatase family protein [Haloferax volcanii]|uniref:fructose-bisphosphatase n=3 Tax=Haloferax volcanii TaxID=2246 RepID=A0A384LCQ9_HALVD|nr:inositol monophosphatase [Haloferax volcanii]ADE02184.1 putative inositol-1(or 4)-monophosphatase / fructose-1,6-bisphosphatase, archaeal-type [Haloferax volcanii DS2]ELY31594.1 inositol-1(or 4)-monophosphatase / fructose-1,6-bisphosphatase [Haloferax volcanii DS2]MBS8121095.1 inositol monophosphatase [Haloferax volcanii]MBS8126106.1 inositol monophosphatase [Haloferax volcanii]MBS8129960.1 inositol monophosphatase [Haloferax volcanii]